LRLPAWANPVPAWAVPAPAWAAGLGGGEVKSAPFAFVLVCGVRVV